MLRTLAIPLLCFVGAAGAHADCNGTACTNDFPDSAAMLQVARAVGEGSSTFAGETGSLETWMPPCDRIKANMTTKATELCVSYRGGRVEYTGEPCGSNVDQIFWTSARTIDRHQDATGPCAWERALMWRDPRFYAGECGIQPRVDGGSTLPTTCQRKVVSTTQPPTTQPPTTTPPISPGDCTEKGPPCDFTPGDGISSWFTEKMFNTMFPRIGDPNFCKESTVYTYKCFILATLRYPAFAQSPSRENNIRELAAWLAEMSAETTGGGCNEPGILPDGSCTCGPGNDCDKTGGCASWGLCKVVEGGVETFIPPSWFCDQTSPRFPCVPGADYRGRGPKQISYNSNYGAFSESFCGDENILLRNPGLVATNSALTFASSMWFWMTGGACDKGSEKCKPTCHEVFLGEKKMCGGDIDAHRVYGLGWATNVINGGVECGGSPNEQKCNMGGTKRVLFYKHYCKFLNVDPLAPGWTEDDNLYCYKQMSYGYQGPDRRSFFPEVC